MRSFIAIELGNDIKKKIVAVQNRFHSVVNGKFVLEDQLHATLFFFEDFKGDLNGLKSFFLNEAFESLTAIVKGVDFFSHNREPKILYLSFYSEGIYPLYQKIRGFLDQHGAFYDKKPFKEHITLCRIKSVTNKDLFYERVKNESEMIRDIKFEILGIAFYKSTLTNKGPLYEKLFSMGGR
ncbi:MAG: RNA 2',3'-cyclic phosphodiesterase [Calditerrivibrio sp.]|nr:RNA 2',3'-cyclic phosphodiesterase [Calditerrivibrio sp.]